MNHSHHGHHGHNAGGTDDEASIEESTTKKLIIATMEMITTTLSPSAMDDDAHSHHDHRTGDSSLSAAAPSVTDHSTHGSHGDGGHWMKMWFHGGYDEVILFDSWRIDSLTGLILSCIVTFILAALYEGLKWFRVYLKTVFESRQSALRKSHASNGTLLLSSKVESGRSPCPTSTDIYAHTIFESNVDVQLNLRQSLFSAFHLVQTALYVAQLILAYWLMLIIMTYNVYLSLAVVFGAGFGHLVFASFARRSYQAEAFIRDACH